MGKSTGAVNWTDAEVELLLVALNANNPNN